MPTTCRPFAPMVLTASSSASRPRATMATSAPEAANRFAMASPMPLLPPVITAVRPARLTSIRILPLAPAQRARPASPTVPGAPGKAAGTQVPPVNRSSAAAYGLEVAHEAPSSRMLRLDWSTTMEFTALFLAVAVVMVVAWWGTRALALALLAATRGFRHAADLAAHHAWRSRLWLGAARLPPLQLGLHRLCRCHHCARSRAAVRRTVQGRRQAAARRRVCARRRLVDDRAHRAECGFDAAGMRLQRLSGQPARLRTPQTPAVRLALTPMILGRGSALIFHLKSLPTRPKTDTPSC